MFVFLMSLYLFIFYLEYIRKMGRALSLQAVRENEKAGAECHLSSPYSFLDVLANTLSWDTTWHSGRCQRLLKEKGFGRIYKPFPWEFLFWFLFCLQTKQDFIFWGGGVQTFPVSVDDRLFSALRAKYTTGRGNSRGIRKVQRRTSVTFSASQLQ